MKKQKWAVMVVMALLGLSLIGCTVTSGIRIGWKGSSSSGGMRYTFTRFDGQISRLTRVQPSGLMRFTYDVTVAEGSLALTVESPDGDIVWEQAFQESASDTVLIPLESSGRSKVVIAGQDARGGFDVTWTVVDPF